MFKISTAVAAFVVSGFMGLACNNSRVVGNVADAALATGGQGGTTGSLSSQGEICDPAPDPCNNGGQTIIYSFGPDAIPAPCPLASECYILSVSCASGQYAAVTCVLAQAPNCAEPVSCNPGDSPITSDEDCGVAAICYTKVLCTRSIRCRPGVYGGICSGIWSDGGVLESPDVSADGDNAGGPPCCGDGIWDEQRGEECDLGEANGACVDDNGNFAGYPGDTGCSAGTGPSLCTRDCQIIWDGP